MQYFHQMMLDLVKQDAFTMEIGAYKAPWLPDPEVVVDAFRAFTEKVFDFWGDDRFLACANYVAANQPLLLCIRKSRNDYCQEEMIEEAPEVSELSRWLHKKLDSVTSWHKRQNRDFIIAPYIVQKSPLIQTIRADEEGWSISSFNSMKEAEKENFLYTTPYLWSQTDSIPPFHRAYYSAALVIGVEFNDDHTRYETLRTLFDLSETLSIQFQMKWGYPQLLRQRVKDERLKAEEREARKKEELERAQEEAAREAARRQEELERAQEKAAREQTKVAFEHTMRANEIAMDLAVALGPAFAKAVQLNKLLKPLPSFLLLIYRRVSSFIPNDNHKVYCNHWRFMHGWDLELICRDPESFKAQIACILLSYLGVFLPDGEGTYWSIEGHQCTSSVMSGNVIQDTKEFSLQAPWSSLMEKGPHLSVLESLSPCLKNLIRKILTQTVPAEWDEDDVEAFDILKGCFKSPFKKRSNLHGNPRRPRLTGPLLMLWTLERHGRVDSSSRDYLLGESAYSADGWPALDILPPIHSIVFDVEKYEERCEISLCVIQSGDDQKVKITIPVQDQVRFNRMRDHMNKRTEQNNGSEEMGNIEDSIKTIFREGGTVEFSAGTGIEITFSPQPI